MKILYFIESLHAGGKERRLIELIRGIRTYSEANLEIVLLSGKIHYKEIFEIGVKIHFIKRNKSSRNFSVFFHFLQLVRKSKPDLIHVWGNVAAFYTIPAKIIFQTPLINNQITDAPRSFKSRLTYKLNFHFADLIIANSKAGLKSYHPPSNKSIVIYNGFNFSRLGKIDAKTNIKKQLGISTMYIVGMVATFSERKDYRTYIKAALEVLSQRNDVSFLCIGDGDSSKFQKLLKNKEKEKILFLGRRNDIESLMNSCDIGILSTFTEGIPNSIMEFMALAKPVIVTNGGGTSELVTNNKTGYLVTAQNAKEISSRIIDLLNNPEKLIRMGILANKRIESEFNISKMVETYKSNYNTLCVE